jgi:acyl carrier protein
MSDSAEIPIRATIIEEIHRIAELHNKTLADLTDSLPLLETGLDSLCLAVLVASLDDALEIDPFSDDHGSAFPVTLGDFIQLYENAAQ